MANDIEKLARNLNDVIDAATIACMIALPLGVLMFVTECRKHQPPAAVAPAVANVTDQSAAAERPAMPIDLTRRSIASEGSP